MKYHSDGGDSCVGKEEGGKWPKPTLICIVGIWGGLELLPNLLSSAAIFPGLVFLRSYLPAPGSFKSAGLSAACGRGPSPHADISVCVPAYM